MSNRVKLLGIIGKNIINPTFKNYRYENNEIQNIK